MKLFVHFVSADNKAVHIEISNEGCADNQYFSISGSCGSSCGQIYDDFVPTDAQAKLVKIWKESHLKSGECLDIMEQCRHIVDEINKEREKRFAAFENEYDINEDNEDMFLSLADVFNDTDDVMRVTALARCLGLCYDEALDIEVKGHCLYEAQGIQYYVGYECELEEIAKERLDRDWWVECVRQNQTDLGYDEWRDECIECDGIGEILNSFDGTVDTIQIDNDIYLVCRDW